MGNCLKKQNKNNCLTDRYKKPTSERLSPVQIMGRILEQRQSTTNLNDANKINKTTIVTYKYDKSL